jgi:hypothetical protein
MQHPMSSPFGSGLSLQHSEYTLNPELPTPKELMRNLWSDFCSGVQNNASFLKSIDDIKGQKDNLSQCSHLNISIDDIAKLDKVIQQGEIALSFINTVAETLPELNSNVPDSAHKQQIQESLEFLKKYKNDALCLQWGLDQKVNQPALGLLGYFDDLRKESSIGMDLRNMGLTKLPPYQLNPNITSIDASDNQIKTLNLTGLPSGVNSVNLSGNTGINLEGCIPPNLSKLGLSHCGLSHDHLKNVIWDANQHLELDLRNNKNLHPLPALPSSCVVLFDLDMPIQTLLTSPEIPKLSAWETWADQQHKINQAVNTKEIFGALVKSERTKTLQLAHKQISEVPPNVPPGLKRIYINNNEHLKNLPPTLPETLEELNVARCSIESLLSSYRFPRLKLCYLDGNKLKASKEELECLIRDVWKVPSGCVIDVDGQRREDA